MVFNDISEVCHYLRCDFLATKLIGSFPYFSGKLIHLSGIFKNFGAVSSTLLILFLINPAQYSMYFFFNNIL